MGHSRELRIKRPHSEIQLEPRGEFGLSGCFMLFKEDADVDYLVPHHLCPYLHLLCLLRVIFVALAP